MPRDSRFDILFEPLAIGPLVAKNRFFQVPHCNGMGHAKPRAHAAMRGIKAEGGWAVVSTEEVEIHPSSDVSPYMEGRLWDDTDIPALELLTGAVHAHGALAAIELVHAGMNAPNLYSREVAFAPSAIATSANYSPAQARAMNKSDIRDFRRWHRQAALRAKRAGFDVIYVYAAHSLSLPMHFLQKRHNHRQDEYGGSLENRARLLRELIEDTKEAVGATCAVAVRFAVDELRGADGITAGGEGREVDCHARRIAGLVGRQCQRLGSRFQDFAIRGGRFSRGVRSIRQDGDDETRGRRRALHLAGRDGLAAPARRAGFHRRGPAVDRRSFFAQKDRKRRRRRHP